MKERLFNLLTIKSLVTLAMTIVFCILALCGVISGQEFLTVFTTVIAFYYGTQAQKRSEAAKAAAGNAVGVVGTVEEKPAQTSVPMDRATYEKMHPNEADVSRR